ncbi:uncharacterized protein LAESUDRAFT_724743 [Laetiporus sulphureus 93-53]|uniref:Uncharacterized protein n=1 Tax=Laetiporus sulphureus 93-53 TaxID=1314785 RepID=A0A165ETV2_9APHY|nr:uncharacterized protein LAESUDRAFT_724743 [Laetiporus sulphureus 93-53]KZT07749.1 hypothetical protein LAESUDRAFT_724743 [Laetiporus sulphureus 93-53]
MNLDTVTSCMANFVTSNLLIILNGIISDVVTILRIYAVTGGDRRPVMFLTLLAVFNVVSNVYSSFQYHIICSC